MTQGPKPLPRPSNPVIEQDNATGDLIYWEYADNQSSSDANGTSQAEYIHAIFFYLRQIDAKHVLMIGAGGGTLATMLHRVGARATMVDVDPRAFTIARRYFHLPDEVDCRLADGAAFLRRSKKTYDAIVLDAYGDNGIPRHLLTDTFFAQAKAHLRPRNALFLLNIIVADDDDRTPDNIARRMRKTWSGVKLLDADGWIDRNALIMAGSVRNLLPPRLLVPPLHGARILETGLKDLSFRALRR